MGAALRRTALRPSIYGYRALPHQERFHADPHKIRLFIGGNRSGKTVGGAAEAVLMLAGEHPVRTPIFGAPVRLRGVGVDFESGINRIMLPEIARWIPPSLLKNGSWEDSYVRGERTLYLTNGSVMEFLSNDQDVEKHAGVSRHGIWIDEECDQEIYNENLARTIDSKGHIWMTVTPLQELSWTYDRIYTKGKANDPNIGIHEVSTTENPYISSAEMDIMTDGMGDAEKKARLTGAYISQSGTIFKQVLKPDVFIEPIVNTEKWPLYMSKWGFFGCLDHGYTNPTAFYIIAFDGEGRMVVCDEYYERGRVVEENAVAILSRIRQLRLTQKLLYVVADPSIRNKDPITGTSIQAEYAEAGLFLGLGNNDVDAGINRLSNRFRKKLLFITKDCEHLIWELPRYRWDKFQSRKIAERRNAKESPLKKDDHGIDAIRYGVVSRPALPGEHEFKYGNIIDAPVAITNGERFDEDLWSKMGASKEKHFDETLGTEW
jgi:phage terminase large subunit-like protein